MKLCPFSQAMLTILEVQDLELLRLRALYCSDDLRRLEIREKERKGRQSPAWRDHPVSYTLAEVKGKKEEIEKLTQRIALLRNHCEESIQQVCAWYKKNFARHSASSTGM